MAAQAAYVIPATLFPYVKEYLPDFSKWKTDSYRYVEVPEFALYKPNGLFSDLLLWLSEHMDSSANLLYRCEAYRNEVVGNVKLLLARDQPLEITVVQAALQLKLSFMLVGKSTSSSTSASGSSTKSDKQIVIKVHRNEVQQVADFLNNIQGYANKIRETLPIFRFTYAGFWSGERFECSTEMKHVALPEAMEDTLLAALDKFVKGETTYVERGEPWCFGLLLHGHPGTGKTKTLKAIANKYRLNIYDLDLSLVYDNAQLARQMREIEDPAMVVIEDIDGMVSDQLMLHTDVPNPAKQRALTISALLNSLDGMASHRCKKRVFAITANDVSKLPEKLLRHRRIDLKLELTFATSEVALKLLTIYHGPEAAKTSNAGVRFARLNWLQGKCTPAELGSILDKQVDAITSVEAIVQRIQH